VVASTLPEEKPAVPETTAAPVVRPESPIAEPVATEAAASIPATPAPEVAQPLAAVSEAGTEAISAAVKELEEVAAKYEAERSTVSPEPVSDKSLQAAALESPAVVADAEPKPEEKIEEKVEQKIEEKIEQKIEEKVEEKIEAKVEEQPKAAELPEQAVAAAETAEAAVPQDAPPVEKIQEEKATQETETPAPVAKAERHEEESQSEEVSPEPEPVSRTSRAGGSDEMAKRESETAAAWASWRKIRETGGSKSAPPAEASVKEAEDSIPEDRAAMAVAAGAERKPEEVTGSFDSDPEIASIVDSVLADMRPKIVEEIARKLGKKK
jgi:hypothetical protein